MLASLGKRENFKPIAGVVFRGGFLTSARKFLQVVKQPDVEGGAVDWYGAAPSPLWDSGQVTRALGISRSPSVTQASPHEPIGPYCIVERIQ